MISKQRLDNVRQAAEEFRRLTDDGDFADLTVVIRYSQLSAELSLRVPALLDEICRLQQIDDQAAAQSRAFVKMDRSGGVA